MAKMKKSSTRIDMTAMCDVSFLLLTFFVLTSTAKTPEVYPVDLPASTKETKIPTDDILTITVGQENVFIGLAGREDRRSEEHTSELQSRPHLVCRLLLEKKKNK